MSGGVFRLRRSLARGAVAALVVLAAAETAAQDYPNRPIKVVAPAPPGELPLGPPEALRARVEVDSRRWAK